MINKKIFISIAIFFIIIIFGFVKINIINTKALSPIGNAENNYEKIINEFGEEFEEFIKDDSYIKIYKNKDPEGRTTVKIGKTEILVKSSNIVIEKIGEYYSYFLIGYGVVKNDLKNKINSIDENKKTIENKEETINVNSEINLESEKEDEKKEINYKKNEENKLDKIVEDFIKNKE